MDSEKIRNFCIIAHIDHGKSTLADRMMEITGTVEKRKMQSQLLDSMELEREKGITIKLTPVQMQWKGYELNLIDTPGHVDFSYEVSRSLQAVESAILVVDATQGIQAQTLANVYLAIDQDLTIIPVINKVDLPAADVEKVSAEIVNLLGCESSDIISVSAKTGMNVEKVLDAVIERTPAPSSSHRGRVRAARLHGGAPLMRRFAPTSQGVNASKLRIVSKNGIRVDIFLLRRHCAGYDRAIAAEPCDDRREDGGLRSRKSRYEPVKIVVRVVDHAGGEVGAVGEVTHESGFLEEAVLATAGQSA